MLKGSKDDEILLIYHTVTVRLAEAVLQAHVSGGHGEDGQVRVDRQIVADELVSCLPDHVPGVSE